MTQHDLICRELHQAFLEKWPLEKVRTMSLREYISQGDPDSFCSWLERRTKPIGNISGSYSTIFEIFERQPGRPEINTKSLRSVGRYTWYKRNPGDTPEEAFLSVRDKIIRIIEAAQAGNLEAVERIRDFPPMTRWKIAFLYAPLGTMAAVLAPAAMARISAEKGIMGRNMAELHRRLILAKPPNLEVYQYCLELFWPRYPQYFVMGSKYGDDARQDMLPQMLDQGVICTDFGPKSLSLAQFYPEPDTESLKLFLEEHACPSLDHSSSQLALFLSMRIGDIVAVKSSGNPKHGKPFLGIRAYAIVVERDGKTYYYDETLGHCLNVAFLKSDFHLELELGQFSQTVHRVEEEAHRQQIFQHFSHPDEQQILTHLEAEQEKRRTRKGVSELPERPDANRRAIDETVINYRHHFIQGELLEFLKARYDDDIKAEENFIDIKRTDKNGKWVELYEVKPYNSPFACIREALGQLLDYAHLLDGSQTVRLIVVGPTQARARDQKYIQFIRDNLKIDFEYRAWRGDFEI